ncbi:MAG: aldose 1-epimerase family protein [Thermoguttaceae bacterium]
MPLDSTGKSLEYSHCFRPNKAEKSLCCRVSHETLHGGKSEGVKRIQLDNGLLNISILPTRGMGIQRIDCSDVQLKWDAPITGPVHPNWVPLMEPSGLGWLDGFDEWLVRCGLESNGAPEFDPNGILKYPLHGRIANLPADEIETRWNDETGEMSVFGIVNEARMFFKKLQLKSTIKTFAGSNQFVVQDTITNLSNEAGEFELLYHINTGHPFVTKGATLHIPFERMAPRTEQAARELSHWNVMDVETPKSSEVVYFFEPAADGQGRCCVLLANETKSRGFHLSFSKTSFPYFSFWKSRLSNRDGYVCGIEPSVNFPNTKSFEKANGRVVHLEPNESRSFELEMTILSNEKSVAEMIKSIEHVAAERRVEPNPVPEWSE